jgi:lysophospholipase L1-like esterase
MTIELNAALPATRAGRLLEGISGRRRPIIGAAGDSIADFLMGNASDNATASSYLPGNSPLFWALLDYPADVFVDGRSYANGKYNFGVGGSTSAQMVANQTAQVQARVGDLLFIQTGQNDGVTSRAQADASAANIETFAASTLAAGWGLIAILGLPPSNNINATDRPVAVDHFNRRLWNYARRTAGVIFLDVTPLVMDPASASTTQVRFRGTAGSVGAYSDDGTHYTAEGARAQAPLIIPLLQQLARPRQPRMAFRHAFDKANCPGGSIFGSFGLFTGSGGNHNGAASPNVAAGWQVSDSNGVVVAPTLVTDGDGYIAQRLSLSGTASAAATIVLGLQPSAAFIATAPGPGAFGMEAVVNATGLGGTAGIELTCGSAGVGCSLSTFSRLPAFTKRMFLATRQPASFGAGNSWGAALVINYAAGATASGSIEISRFGVFLEN